MAIALIADKNFGEVTFKKKASDTVGAGSCEELQMVSVEEAEADKAVAVLEGLEATETENGVPRSALFMAATMLGSKNSVTALEGVGGEVDVDAVVEGIMGTVGEKIKDGLNAIARAILRPVNAMLDLGGKLSRWKMDHSLTSAISGKSADEVVFGKKLDGRTIQWIVGGVVAALAIGSLFIIRLPQATVGVSKAIRAAREAGVAGEMAQGMPKYFPEFVTKINSFKWPFGEFTASVSDAASHGFGKMAVKFKQIDRLKALKASGKQMNISEFKLFVAKAVTMGKAIVKAAGEITKNLWEWVATSAKMFDETMSIGIASKIGKTGGVLFHATKVFGYSCLALIGGFVGKVVLEGTHFVMSALESWTSDAEKHKPAE